MNTKMQNSWVVIGFDYRVRNTQQKSIDAIVWEQDDELVEKLLSQGVVLSESLYQFWNSDINDIERYASQTTALAFAVSTDSLTHNKELDFRKEQITPYLSGDLLSRGWKIIDYDVADANGYFSFIGMDFSGCGTDKLFDNWEDAEKLVPIADKRVPEHSPFAVFMLLEYQNQDN